MRGSFGERQKKAEQLYSATTSCGEIKGLRQEGCLVFEGVKYAEAGRWEDPQVIRGWEGVYDATAAVRPAVSISNFIAASQPHLMISTTMKTRKSRYMSTAKKTD